MTQLATARNLPDPLPGAIKANFDVQQALSASVASTLSEYVALFGALQLDATKAALTGSLGAARGFLYGAAPGPEPACAEYAPSPLALHQERVKEAERKRIARELHDELGGLLTSVKAHISVAQARLAAAGLAEEDALATASRLTDDAVETLRRVIIDLRPSVLDQLGIWAALEWYAERIASQNGLQSELRIEPAAAAVELDAERSTAVYRIVQEAATNVLRHAGARRIAIRARRAGADLRIEICDDGCGIDGLRAGASFGIAGMHERARGIGGDLTVSSAPGVGTCVALRLPLGTNHGH
jgi:two-component system sensor histidine kinase UhpB